MSQTPRRALVREPGGQYSRCISSHPLRHTIDIALAREQHRTYVLALEEAGLDIVRLERDDAHPDSCFVEDTAVVHGQKALICRPAKESRRGEVDTVEAVLSQHLQVKRATGTATVEGGDVLHLEDRLVSGVTDRTNDEGVNQMRSWLGTRVDTVRDPSVMHLKSHISHIGRGKVLVAGRFAQHPALSGLEKLVVPDDEGYAANVLQANGTVLMPLGFPKTMAILEEAGLKVVPLQMGEFPKCDGAMTCLSILF